MFTEFKDMDIPTSEDMNYRTHLVDNDTLLKRRNRRFEKFHEEMMVVMDFCVECAKNVFSLLQNEKIFLFFLCTFLSLGVLTTISLVAFSRIYIEESVLYHLIRLQYLPVEL